MKKLKRNHGGQKVLVKIMKVGKKIIAADSNAKQNDNVVAANGERMAKSPPDKDVRSVRGTSYGIWADRE